MFLFTEDVEQLFFYQAFPPAKYFWQFENGTRTKNGPVLEFKTAVRRSDGGVYTCTAFNEMGNSKAESKNKGIKFITL